MFPKITRGTLAGQAAERLLEYIENQRMQPGDLLPSEASLAASFGVSRPVIREALKSLVGQGVIEIVNGKGALIRPIDSDPLRVFFHRAMQMDRGAILELMEVRRGLEVQAAALAAKRRTGQDIQNIQQVVKTMRGSMDDLEAYTNLDVEFHFCIAAASHNTMMVYLVESIRGALRSSIVAGLRGRGEHSPQADQHMRDIQSAHEQLLEALVEGSEAQAMQAMMRHFDIAVAAIGDPQNTA